MEVVIEIERPHTTALSTGAHLLFERVRTAVVATRREKYGAAVTA